MNVEVVQRRLWERSFPQRHARRYDVPVSHRELETTLARYYAEQNNLAGAKRVLEQGIARRAEQLGQNHLLVALAELRYGEFLVDQRQLDDAEPMLLTAFDHLQSNPAAVAANLERASAELVQVYEALKDEREVAEWRARVEQYGQLRKSIEAEQPHNETEEADEE